MKQIGHYALKINQMHEAKRLYLEEGWSQQDLANYYGVTRTAIQSAFAYLGVKSRTPLEGRLVYFEKKLAA